MEEEILFSLIITTYNHEQYIGQALESVLSQKTEYKYEIIIGEDCSTDKTRSVIKKYQKRYPEIIRPVYHKNNMGGTKKSYYAIGRARGRYIAFMDGDDLWCDDNRIQKDVTFLEAHQEYTGVCHHCKIIDVDGKEVTEGLGEKQILNLPENTVYTFEDFKKWKLPGHISCITARNIFPEIDYRILYKASDIIGDRTISMLLSLDGPIFRDFQVVSCYRYRNSADQKNFTAEFANKNWRDKEVLTIRKLELWLEKKKGIKFDFTRNKKNLLAASVVVWMKNPSRYNFRVIGNIIRYSGNPARYLYDALRVFMIKLYSWHILGKDYRIEF